MREKYTLINNSAALAEELAPEELVDDMVEHFIITLKDHENICRRYITEKEMSNLLLEALIENVEKGSYPCLLYLLENSMEARQFEYVGNLLKKELPPTSPETGMAFSNIDFIFNVFLNFFTHIDRNYYQVQVIKPKKKEEEK